MPVFVRRRFISSSPLCLTETVGLELSEIKDMAKSTLLRAGASDEHAEAVADVVMRAEQDCSLSHGLFRVPGYVAG